MQKIEVYHFAPMADIDIAEIVNFGNDPNLLCRQKMFWNGPDNFSRVTFELQYIERINDTFIEYHYNLVN